MTALLAVELRRFAARRLVRLFVALAVVGIVIAGVMVFFKTPYADDPSIAEEISLQREGFLMGCVGGFEFEPVPGGRAPDDAERRAKCEEIMAQELESADPRFYLSGLPENLRGTTVPWVLLSVILGASMIGAEWRAGTLTTQLTWEPRRARLLATKALAAVIGCGVVALAGQVLLTGALLPTVYARGVTAGAGGVSGEIAGVILRSGAIAAFGAAVGFAIGHIGRNTAVALGAAFVYLAILEAGLIGGAFPGIRRWLVVGNSVVFVGGGTGEIPGRTVAEAGIILAVYAVAAVAVACAVFRARDVT